MTIRLLKYFGWNFISLDYELKPTDSRSPFMDLHDDLLNTIKEQIKPIIEKEIEACDFFSEYEKKRIATFIAWQERWKLCQSMEILHLLELLKGQIDKPRVILLHQSRWSDVVSAKYSGRGFDVHFYRIYFPLKVQLRSEYIREHPKMAAIRYNTLFNLLKLFRGAVLDTICSAYFRVLRKVRSDIPQELGRFDMCAVVPGYNRTQWVCDLHWKKIYNGNIFRTLAIPYGELDDYSYANFGDLAERWITLGWISCPRAYSVFYWLWPLYPKILVYNLGWLLWKMLFSNISFRDKMMILLLFMEVSKMQALFKITGARVFWSSIEGNDYESLAGALAINREGGVSLGSTWSAFSFPGFASQRVTNDIIFVWGRRHVDIFSEGGATFKSLVMAGYPGDYCLKNYISEAAQLRKTWKKRYGCKNIICFYDNVFARDDFNNFSNVVSYMDNLLSWIEKREDSLLVIKTKRGDDFSNYPAQVVKSMKYLRDEKRLAFEYGLGNLAPGLGSDIVLGLGPATLPCLLGTYGKEVILFDANRVHEKWPIEQGNITFITTSEEITERLNLLLAKKDNGGIDKPEMGVNPIPNSLDHFADEKSVERLNGYILSLIQGLNDGLTSDETIKEANLRYRKKWYLESIVEFG